MRSRARSMQSATNADTLLPWAAPVGQRRSGGRRVVIARAQEPDYGADLLSYDSLATLTVAKLKVVLRSRNLPGTGVKDDLIRRIIQAEQDRLAAQAAGGDGAADGSGGAQTDQTAVPPVDRLFPDGGPMPPVENVSITDLRRELQARGCSFSEKDRYVLHERLTPLVLNAQSLDSSDVRSMSDEELTEWLQERGAILPRNVTRLQLLDMVNAGLTQEQAAAAAGKSANFGGYTESELLSTYFDPATVPASQLKLILKELNASMLGSKRELEDRLRGMIDVARGGVRGLSLAVNGRSPQETRIFEEAARETVAQMAPGERSTLLAAQGYPTGGTDNEVAERLIALMVVESRVPEHALREARRGDALAYASLRERERAALTKEELQSRGTGLFEKVDRDLYDDDDYDSDDGDLDLDEPLVFNDIDDSTEQPEEPEEPQNDWEAARDDRIYELDSPVHWMLRQVVPRTRVAVVCGGPGTEAAVSLAAARTVLTELQTRPYDDQEWQMLEFMDEVRTCSHDFPCMHAPALLHVASCVKSLREVLRCKAVRCYWWARPSGCRQDLRLGFCVRAGKAVAPAGALPAHRASQASSKIDIWSMTWGGLIC